jgi:hypothetical protein
MQLHFAALVRSADPDVHGNDHDTMGALNQGEVNAEEREKVGQNC